MITLLAAAFTLSYQGQQSISLTPTDDVWVYPHATDPTKDEYLRFWGADDAAVADSADDNDSFSYSYLKWDLSSVPTGAKLKSAKLILTHVAARGFDLQDAKDHPVEVRSLPVEWSERTWSYDQLSSAFPGKTKASVFGVSSIAELPQDDKPFRIQIDLMKGPNNFADYFGVANRSIRRQLALALTSTMSPSDGGQSHIYKVYSEDSSEANRPVLELTFE